MTSSVNVLTPLGTISDPNSNYDHYSNDLLFAAGPFTAELLSGRSAANSNRSGPDEKVRV